eukprot:1488395-Prymnesium_polylepis.1
MDMDVSHENDVRPVSVRTDVGAVALSRDSYLAFASAHLGTARGARQPSDRQPSRVSAARATTYSTPHRTAAKAPIS